MTLNTWEKRLEDYFAQLRKELNDAGNFRPLFALEHNLDAADLSDLIQGLRDYIGNSAPAERHWAVWSVYAAEIGYKFQGDEYWQTFAQDLAGWAKNEDRDFIRRALFTFHKRFQGAAPSGDWAKNFTIICWPITHAILPKDLQRHLASVLYDVRGSFTVDLLNKTEVLGSLIAANSEGTSSRFRKFVEGRELVGRIASALLRAEPGEANDLLEPNTLRRIAQDLQEERIARDWLSAARQRASAVTLTGLRARSSPIVPRLSQLQAFAPAGPTQVIREQVELIARQIGQDSWCLKAVLPNLSHVASDNVEFQKIFAAQRSFIEASDKNHFSPRYFSFNRQEVVLRKWPAPRKSILRFEPSTAALVATLDACCSLEGSARLLFRLREDDNAILVRSKTLKPGLQYLFLDTAQFTQSPVLSGSKKVNVSCEGLNALCIDVPTFVSSSYEATAKGIGLDIASDIHLAPVGYPPKTWTGDGDVTWHESAPKILGITSSIEAPAIVLNLSGNRIDQTLHEPLQGRGPIFIDMTELTAGRYQLNVAAEIDSARRQILTGTMQIEVVPDADRVLSTESAQGFRVLPSPTLPSLEQLWNGEAKINIYGPLKARIKAQVAFHPNAEGGQTNFRYALGKLTLPFRESEWNSCFKRVREDKSARAAYEDAASCSLVFRSQELGESTLHVEREFVPFRWSVRSKNSSQRLKLMRNDSADNLTTLKASYEQPSSFTRLALNAGGECEETGAGGLVVARSASSFAALILPPVRMTGFAALKPTVVRIASGRDPESLINLCHSLKFWVEADLLGDPVSQMKRDAAVMSLRSSLIELICGVRWLTCESDVEHARRPPRSLVEIVASPGDFILHRSLLEACRKASELSSDELALVALDIAMSRGLVQDVRDGREPPPSRFPRTFMQLLRVHDHSAEAVAWVDQEAANFALMNAPLMRIIRLLQLAAQDNDEAAVKPTRKDLA